ncbi:MAG: hypothetical protein WDZ68_01060 [Candidatus Paceibacterota bacterium]
MSLSQISTFKKENTYFPLRDGLVYTYKKGNLSIKRSIKLLSGGESLIDTNLYLYRTDYIDKDSLLETYSDTLFNSGNKVYKYSKVGHHQIYAPYPSIKVGETYITERGAYRVISKLDSIKIKNKYYFNVIVCEPTKPSEFYVKVFFAKNIGLIRASFEIQEDELLIEINEMK